MPIFEALQQQVAAMNTATEAVQPNFGLLIETTRDDQIQKMERGQSVLLHADLKPAPDGKGRIMTTRMRQLNEDMRDEDLPGVVDYLTKKGVQPVIFVGEKTPEGQEREEQAIADMVNAALRMTSSPNRGNAALGNGIRIATNSPKILRMMKEGYEKLKTEGKVSGNTFDALVMVRTAGEAASSQWTAADGSIDDTYAGTQLALRVHPDAVMDSGKKLKTPGINERATQLYGHLATIAGKAAAAKNLIMGKPAPAAAAPTASATGRRVLTVNASAKRPTTAAPQQWVLITQGKTLIR
jgi:hypothetical protein